MTTIDVRLPDGKTLSLPSGSTVLEVAAAIGPGLAKAALAGRIEGQLIDLRVSLEAHIAKCPDCWVIFDETRKTVEIFQNLDCHPLPQDVHDRLLDALKQQWNK